VVTITDISSAGVARIYNVYNPGYVKRVDTLNVSPDAGEIAIASTDIKVIRQDSLIVAVAEDRPSIHNTIAPTQDTLKVRHIAEAALTNIHSVMKAPSRHIYGKVYITYADPLLETETTVEANMSAYNSNPDQLIDAVTQPDTDVKYFTLYDNDLSGEYSVMSERSQIGWVTDGVSNASGVFADEPYVTINFASRPVLPLTIFFDDSHGCVAKDFTVQFKHENGTTTTRTFTGNTASSVQVTDEALVDVVAVTVRIQSGTVPGYAVAILEIPIISTVLYEGYQDRSSLMSIDTLEELTYDDSVEALGGISANSTTIVLDNSDRSFYFNNPNQVVASQLKRNRKIEPWLGAEITPGVIEWYKQGTYWSYRWNVPVNGLTATVVGFDTIGLLDTTSFTNHQVLVNKSIGQLVDYVLNDAKSTLSFITWKVDPALYNVIIPYAWFACASHTAALRKISQAYPMHIYCDRDGNICAAPQKLHLDYYYDSWRDSDTVISKEYTSLFTTVPNIVTVNVGVPKLVLDASLAQDELAFNVATSPTRTLNFGSPYVSDLLISMDKDSAVSYTYEVYSWGITFHFTGTGIVRSINCTGMAVDISTSSAITRRDEDSIRVNGAVSRTVSADFIQNSSLATMIIDRIFTLSEQDRYDATVQYRGDISLTINDPILLIDGIAPDNRYNIRRHQLSWNGSLTGTADINT